MPELGIMLRYSPTSYFHVVRRGEHAGQVNARYGSGPRVTFLHGYLASLSKLPAKNMFLHFNRRRRRASLSRARPKPCRI